MIIVPVKEGENIEKALKKFKRKFEKTGVVKELICTEAPEDGARYLRTEASRYRRVKKNAEYLVVSGFFRNFVAE